MFSFERHAGAMSVENESGKWPIKASLDIKNAYDVHVYVQSLERFILHCQDGKEYTLDFQKLVKDYGVERNGDEC